MRVCVLTDEEIMDFDPTPYLKGFDWEMVTLTAPVMDRLRSLAEEGEFDIYLNICEGYEIEDRQDEELGYQGIEVVKALEELNLPFTGADSACFDPTREQMQSVADANGIGFAKGYQVKTVGEAERLVGNLRYPIMIKHPQSYGSRGMTRESRADSIEQVCAQVERICSEFGAARMEEFIIGREFNTLVVDNPDDLQAPFVYPPTELLFPPNEDFWHVDVKWNSSDQFDFKQVTDPHLVGRLQDISKRFYLAMDCTGYGRCDIRMNEAGELFILEINPNSGIMFKPEDFGPADFMILYDEVGYEGFFNRIFRSALVRQKIRSGKGTV